MPTYKQTLYYLFNSMPVFEQIGKDAYKPGLFNSEALDAHFNNPHKKYKTIHIAGTNGKGSCSHTLAAIFQLCGYKVGLYTSPHINDFSERIKINGQCISQQYVIDFVEQNKDFFEPLHSSFFELTTALAFKYFADQNVDIAIIEVGLGGRLDCTNIINPILSIITNIGLDHTDLLGNTLQLIATEKAGIIKPNTPVVIGEYNEQTLPVFCQKAKEMNAPIICAFNNPEVIECQQTENQMWSYKTQHFGTFKACLKGNYQIKNTNTILKAVDVLNSLNFNISADNVQKAFLHVDSITQLYGRWQVLQNNPTIICDTGHNSHAWQYIAEQLKNLKCNKLIIVFGMVSDKDIDNVIELLPNNALFFFTQPQCKRALPVATIIEKIKNKNFNYKTFNSVREAIAMAKEMIKKNDILFIGGSNYVVSEALECF